MINKKIYLLLLPLLIGFLMARAVNADFGAPGSSANPVISKSYADKALQPLRERVASLSAEVSRLRGVHGKVVFKDVPAEHWAYGDIIFMVDKGVLKGLGSGCFGPDNPARRCEFAVMIVKALKLPVEGMKADFTDVPDGHWANAEIAAAQSAGIISGFPGGKFKPDEYVTRGQMAVMLSRACSFKRTGQAAEFSDVPADYWAYDAILKLADNRISKGYEDKTFRPALAVRRAEVAVFLAKASDPSRRDH